MSSGTNAGKGRLRDEVELLRGEVAELERLYRRGGPAVAGSSSPEDDITASVPGLPQEGSFNRFSASHLFKEALVAFLALLALMSVATFFPAPLEEVATPTATEYVPRPEWYFLSLFQLLKYFPGNLETVALVAIPTLIVAFLIVLPFIDHNPARLPRKRPIATLGMSAAMAAIFVLTVLAATEKTPGQGTSGGPLAPKPAHVGSVVYTKNCYNCHGLNFHPQADATELQRVVGEGIPPKGMPAFGGVLTADEIQAVSDYVRSSQGAKLFAGFCAGCHGSGVNTSKSATALAAYIGDGNSLKGMPGYGRMLTAPEIAAIASYVASEEGKGSPLPEQAAAAGSALYLKHCASCHGAKGDQIPKADLSSKAFRDRHDEVSLRALIAAGTTGGMPGFAEGKGGSLTEQQVTELARFLRFWEGIADR